MRGGGCGLGVGEWWGPWAGGVGEWWGLVV